MNQIPAPRRRGEDHHSAKLTEASVAEIRIAHASGVSQRELGRRYGVSGEVIGQIIRGNAWRHVPVTPEVESRLDARRKLGKRGEASGRAKLTNADVLSIRVAHADYGVTYTALAKQYGVSAVAISRIVSRRTWSHIR